MNRDDLVAVRDVKQEYAADRATVVRWIAAGKLDSVKVPRDQRTYVRRAQLEAVLREEPAPRGRRGNWRT